MAPEQIPEFSQKTLSEFQLKEYEYIAQAHFKTNEMISSFYRYYFIIIAIPITTISATIINSLGNQELIQYSEYIKIIISSLFIGVFLAGMSITVYIEGLNLDALLYARTVNSIRKFFHKFSKYSPVPSGNTVLPTSTKEPEFNGYGSHFYIFSFCSFLNSVYLGAGVYLLFFLKITVITMVDNSKYITFDQTDCSYVYSVAITMLSFFGHVVWRLWAGSKKEKKWGNRND